MSSLVDSVTVGSGGVALPPPSPRLFLFVRVMRAFASFPFYSAWYIDIGGDKIRG